MRTLCMEIGKMRASLLLNGQSVKVATGVGVATPLSLEFPPILVGL